MISAKPILFFEPLQRIFFRYAGVIILDLEAQNLTEVVYRVVEEMFCDGIIEEEHKSELMRVLLYRHKYVSSSNKGIKIGGLKKNLSQKSLNVSGFFY